MEKTFDVIGVEDLIMDFALQIARIPKTDGMALIEDSCWAGGGNASSAIVALARLGARCAMVGTTGNDAYGAFCRADMEKNGVDVSHVKQVEGETTLCVCLAERETQGRSFLGRAGVAGEMTAEDVDEQLIANARVVHLSCSRCTGQEAAVFLTRTVQALGWEPETVRSSDLPAALARGAWDQEALELAWGWGLLPEDAGVGITRAQGEAMAEALTALAD